MVANTRQVRADMTHNAGVLQLSRLVSAAPPLAGSPCIRLRWPVFFMMRAVSFSDKDEGTHIRLS